MIQKNFAMIQNMIDGYHVWCGGDWTRMWMWSSSCGNITNWLKCYILSYQKILSQVWKNQGRFT